MRNHPENRDPQALLTALPCFSMLTPTESQEVIALMTTKEYSPGQTIVVEEEAVDAVFIIVSGQAEVTIAETVKKKLKKRIKNIPLAILNSGDAIGLNDTGFFSATGMRTATVTALSAMQVLTLTLKDLHAFLKKHPHLHAEMLAATTTILKIKLIKQALPFVRLSHERIQALVKRIDILSLLAGEIIFRQGDAGDKCYMIHTGKIEIFSDDSEGNEQILATLKSPALFGEATLVTRSPRNASARVLEAAELLVLPHEYLSELIESEKKVADMFMTLMVNRSRPLQNPRVSAHERRTVDEQAIVILKNPDNGNYFKLSPEGYFIWERLTGKQTLQAITMALSNEFNLFAPDIVAGLISKLAQAGFVENVVTNGEIMHTGQSFWLRTLTRARGLLEFRYAFGDADKWLTKVYQRGVYLLFTLWGKAILALFASLGFITFVGMTNDTIDTFQLMPNVWVLLILLVPATLLSVALHELGHAFATKSYGHEVHYMGVGWFWFSPIAFTDTSDMWLSTRGPRIAVNLAGIYTDVIVAGLCALSMLIIANPYIQAFLWLFALYTYINAFRMLSPLQELDGYYVLMDVVDKPRLRQAAVVWLVKKLPHIFKDPTVVQQHKPEIKYWLACLVFLLLISILTLSLQAVVLKIFGIQMGNIYISLAIPFLAVAVSSIGIIADIRSKT
jgi:CRP-like cAMP-binding protein/Zn-dependent protease